MHVESFINSEIAVLGMQHKVAEALRLMNEFQVTELPVVDEGKVIALVKESELLEAMEEDEMGKFVHSIALPPTVFAKAHPYEAAVRMAEYKLSLIPIVDENDFYIGVTTRYDLFSHFFERTGLSHPGGIIVLQMKPVDYSLSEIARICESCDASVLNVQLFSEPESELMNVVVKTNQKDLQALKASFERFDYRIGEIFGMLPAQKDLIERYQLLMNYINM